MSDQPLHEGELVGIFLALRRIAVGQVDRSHPQHAAIGRNYRLDEAGVIVGLVARQSQGDLLERELGQDGDPVESLLTVHCNIVAEGFERFAREGLVHAFGLLQANDLGLALGEPSQ